LSSLFSIEIITVFLLVKENENRPRASSKVLIAGILLNGVYMDHIVLGMDVNKDAWKFFVNNHLLILVCLKELSKIIQTSHFQLLAKQGQNI